MKTLQKKRLNPIKLSSAWRFQVASLFRHQVLWYAVSISVYGWFTFWMSYDFFVWHKSLLEGNIVNLVGAVASMAFIWVEAKLFKTERLDKKTEPAKQQETTETQPTLEKPKLAKPLKLSKPRKTRKRQSPQPKTQSQPETPAPTMATTVEPVTPSPEPMPTPPQPTIPNPTKQTQTNNNYNTCIHNKQHQQNPTNPPDQCLTCTHLIECHNNKN